MTSRIIHLRRPPVLQLQNEPFVPASVSMDEIDARWHALCEKNPAYFDGRLMHVIGVHRNGYGGAVIHVCDCAYRFHAVQTAELDLGVRALGVKGMTWRDDRILLGKRANNVAWYAGMWEFAPGGVVEPGDDPATTVIRELHEETGHHPASDPTAIALVYDDVARTWEIVFRIVVAGEPDQPTTAEYEELRWCRATDLPEPLSPVAETMMSALQSPPRARAARKEDSRDRAGDPDAPNASGG